MLGKPTEKKKGFTDRPAVEDEFNIQPYIEGITTFIKSCNTPMTIAIQGDWGTGKTSIMSMIEKKLETEKDNNISKVWFNTWQFSQFNMGDNLPIVMMKKLIDDVTADDKAGVNTKVLKEAGLKVLSGLIDVSVGYVSGGAVDGKNIRDLFASDFLKEFENLKETFQNIIHEKAGTDGRVVIFVDDLDRLAPGKAVELLEVLKIFLDCEQCVFVLAIDYGVVSRGVKEKYGDDFSDEKGKSFFDKIIQVPFKMPVASYDISNYVKKCFADINIQIPDESVGTYKDLINYSIGNNPRGMKRLFNSYLLLSNIATEEILETDDNKEMLFAILCMQSKYEKIYNYIVSQRDELKGDFFAELKKTERIQQMDDEMSEKDRQNFIQFAEAFVGLIDKDNKNGIDGDELASFQNVLNFSTITSANAESAANEDSKRRSIRNTHRDKVNEFVNRLKKEEGFSFEEYKSTRTEETDWTSWWGYLRNNDGYLDATTDKRVRFGWEFWMEETEKENVSALKLGVYQTHRTRVADIQRIMGEDPLKTMNFGQAEVSNHGIYYKVCEFETNSNEKEEEMYLAVKQSFDLVKPYFL